MGGLPSPPSESAGLIGLVMAARVEGLCRALGRAWHSGKRRWNPGWGRPNSEVLLQGPHPFCVLNLRSRGDP